MSYLQSNYLLQQAVSEYETGNLDAAYRHAREALEQPIQQMIYQLFPQNADELYIMQYSTYTSQLFHMHLKGQYREVVSSLLSLIQNRKYEDAASVLLQVLSTGYPLLVAVYTCLYREYSVQKISALFHDCCAYVEMKITQIKAKYQESLAYSHLSLLQYQIDFALYAFFSCLTKKESTSCAISFS